MTRARMLAHIAAVVWHGREAILEGSDADKLPVVVLDLVETDPAVFGIDEGYVAEQSHRDSHILPLEVELKDADDETGEPK